MSTQRCVDKVSSSTWGFHQCRSRGLHEHEGRLYCLRHHPPAVQAKREAQRQKWESKWNAEVAQMTETKRRLDAYEPMLEALRYIADHDLRDVDLTICGHIAHALIGKARDAIKAIETHDST